MSLLELPPEEKAKLQTNLRTLLDRVHRACDNAHRDPADVQVLLATKTQSPERIAAILEAGHHLIGENRAQELRDKAPALAAYQPEWHFIGPLQKNKVRNVVGVARLIHAVDSFTLAEEIALRAETLAQRGADPGPVAILLEVQLVPEANKAGVPPSEALALAHRMATLPRIHLRGLMCIPPPVAHPEDASPYFRQLAQLRAEGESQGLTLPELSMGMSQDFETAIACGATLIRVGSAVFGSRN